MFAMTSSQSNSQAGKSDVTRKATKAEHQARIEVCHKMIRMSYHKSHIKDFFRREYGLGSRQTERYIRLARDRMLQETSYSRDDLVAQSFCFYMDVLRSSDSTTAEKLQARKLADNLLGLPAPKKIAPTSPDGEMTYGAAAMAELMQLAESTDEVRIIDTTFVERQFEHDLAEAAVESEPADSEPACAEDAVGDVD